ncbi:MAG: hypothetical protein GY845_37240 [Planctomycetes bacterium]|nr:hypothetical protein [Planctomycetota bacterium]
MPSNEDSLSKQAQLRFNTLKSVTYTQQKNSGLIQYAKEYIKLGRYDLAVLFVSEITYTQDRNSLSIHIAKKTLASGDFEIAQKAIEAITYTADKNQLGLELLKCMQS